MARPNSVMPWRDMYWPVSSVARLTMQIGVVTRACSKRTPSFASSSIRGVRTTVLPAAPSASHRTSSRMSSTTLSGFGEGVGVCAGADPAVSSRRIAVVSTVLRTVIITLLHVDLDAPGEARGQVVEPRRDDRHDEAETAVEDRQERERGRAGQAARERADALSARARGAGGGSAGPRRYVREQSSSRYCTSISMPPATRAAKL